MSNRRLLYPESVRERILGYYNKRREIWLAGGEQWPMEINLGHPREQDAAAQPDVISGWIGAWQKWEYSAQVQWHETCWRRMGVQKIPVKLAFNGPEQVAEILGQIQHWRKVTSRYTTLCERFPQVQEYINNLFDVLADYDDKDYERLQQLAAWLHANRNSGLYPRQLPVAGVDTKWFEQHKSDVVCLLTAMMHSENIPPAQSNVYELCGLRRLPELLRLRLLDSGLRGRLGGVSDISAPLADLLSLPFSGARVFIVENLQTFLSFEELPNSLVIMGMGYNVTKLKALPWINQTDCYYWGDLDTHGFAILSAARSFMPNLRSILMDEAALLRYRDFWVEEKTQHAAPSLPNLTPGEQAVHDGLKQQRWGTNVRLEQERIPWPAAWAAVLSAANG